MKKQRIAELSADLRKFDDQLTKCINEKNLHPQFSPEWNEHKSRENTIRRRISTAQNKIQNLQSNKPELGEGRHVDSQTLPKRK